MVLQSDTHSDWKFKCDTKESFFQDATLMSMMAKLNIHICKSKRNRHCAYEMKNQQMSLFQFYSYIDASLHVSGPQAHPQENSHSCSHNHWFSGCTVRAVCTRPERYSHWTNGCVNSCVNSPEDGPVDPKYVEMRRYMNKIEILVSVGFLFHMLKGCTVQKA
jgi:hypothetical protein